MWIPSPHESIQSFPESSLRKYSSLDYLIPYHQNLLYSDSQSDVPITPIMTANTTSDPLTSQFSRLIDAVSYERWTYHLQETGIPFSPEHDLICLFTRQALVDITIRELYMKSSSDQLIGIRGVENHASLTSDFRFHEFLRSRAQEGSSSARVFLYTAPGIVSGLTIALMECSCLILENHTTHLQPATLYTAHLKLRQRFLHIYIITSESL